MPAPTIPVITAPVTGATRHFCGSEKISVTVTAEAVEQILKVYIGGVLAGTAYTETGGTVQIPNIQLTAGSNVITAKAMNLASELSAASDAITVTGVNTSVSGDVDIISYTEDNLIDYLKSNATVTAMLAGVESVYNKDFPDTLEIFPALRVFDISEETEPEMSCYSLGTVSFKVEAVKLDNTMPGEGIYGNTNYGDTYQGASDIINTVRVQIMTNWPSFLGEYHFLKCISKNKSDIKSPAGGYYIQFEGTYAKPKQYYE